ncbi:MAG: chorismate mutase [Treponema sp.]|nr:chorismate mutase [Treponema sp.]
MDGKRLYCIRGAVCCENTKESIQENVGFLCSKVFAENKICAQDIVSVQFSVTPDLDAMNPATALRLSDTGVDTSAVPLMCSQEPVVRNMLPKVVRLMVTAYLPEGTSVVPSYLNGAQVLRPDLRRESSV